MSIQVNPDRLREGHTRNLGLSHGVKDIRTTLINQSFAVSWDGNGNSYYEFTHLMHRLNSYAEEVGDALEQLGSLLIEAAASYDETDGTIRATIHDMNK